MSRPRYGDNIFAIGGVVRATLKAAEWDRDQIDEIMAQIVYAKSYDEAIGICRQYITINQKGE